jgi:hypothetical protein
MPPLSKGELRDDLETGTFIGAVAGKKAVCRIAGGWRQCNAQGERVDGIAVHDGIDGQTDVSIYSEGCICPALSGAALTDSQPVMTDAAGAFIPYVAGAGVSKAGLCELAVSGTGMSTLIRFWPGGIA